MMLPQPKTIRGVIDQNDLTYVRERGLHPVVAEPCPLGGNGVINPHVTRFHNADGSKTDVFHVKPVYYETKAGDWQPLDEVTSYHGNKTIVLKMNWGEKMSLRFFQWLTVRQQLRGSQLHVEGLVLQPAHYLYATDSTFYPDPSPETSTVDGVCQNVGTVYATVRSASTGSTANDTADFEGFAQHSKFGADYYISRGFFLFDTSSIADGDTISAATFSLYYASGANNADATSSDVTLVATTPASNTAVTTADFDQVGSTSFGVMDITGTDDQYNNITVNSTGIAAISKTSITKFGTKNEGDISGTAPTGLNQRGVQFAEYTGTTRDPKLLVTHAASGLASMKTLDTIAKASVKTINGIAIASVKSINTIT